MATALSPSAPEKARILAPVDRVSEVEVLARAGAHELYGGVRPDAWDSMTRSANQRTFDSAQFADEAQFAEAAGRARDLGLPLHLALNAPLYDPADYPALMGFLERAASWGVAGVIAGDLGLLARLGRAGLSLEVTLSTMAGPLNRWAVQFFRRFGVTRVVLPRHLRLEEMVEMVGQHPDLTFEAFVLIGKCPNEEGYCTFQHTHPSRRWPCEIPYALERESGEPLGASHPLSRWHQRWGCADRRLACGLCGIQGLRDAGVTHFKIVGRGGPTAAKEANVKLVAAFLGEGRSASEARSAYRERFGHACRLLECYFPQFHPDAEAGV